MNLRLYNIARPAMHSFAKLALIITIALSATYPQFANGDKTNQTFTPFQDSKDDKIIALEQENKKLNNTITAKNKEINELNSKNRGLEQDKHKLQGNIQYLTKNNEITEKNLRAEKTKNTNLQSEKDNLAQKLSNTKKEKENQLLFFAGISVILLGALAIFLYLWHTAKKTSDKQKQTIDKLNSDKQLLIQEKNNLNTKLNAIPKDIHEANQQIESLQKDKDTLKNELKSATDSATQWETSCANIETKYRANEAALQTQIRTNEQKYAAEKQRILENANKKLSFLFPQYILSGTKSETTAFLADVHNTIDTAQIPESPNSVFYQKFLLMHALGKLKTLLDANNNEPLYFTEANSAGMHIINALKEIGEIIPKCDTPSKAFDSLNLWSQIIFANTGDTLRNTLKLYVPSKEEIFENALMQKSDPNKLVSSVNRIHSWAITTADSSRVFLKAIVA